MTTATLSQFAELLGVNKSTVTRYKQSGRLVMTDEGLVDIEASIECIKETADPNRDDVVRRHKKNKGVETMEETSESSGYQAYRAKKEKYHALLAKLDYEKSTNLLVERAEVDRCWSNVAQTVRSSVERIPDVLATALAEESDPDRIAAILVEQIESALKHAADQIKAAT